jgi:hypothetical protein
LPLILRIAANISRIHKNIYDLKYLHFVSTDEEI